MSAEEEKQSQEEGRHEVPLVTPFKGGRSMRSKGTPHSFEEIIESLDPTKKEKAKFEAQRIGVGLNRWDKKVSGEKRNAVAWNMSRMNEGAPSTVPTVQLETTISVHRADDDDKDNELEAGSPLEAKPTRNIVETAHLARLIKDGTACPDCGEVGSMDLFFDAVGVACIPKLVCRSNECNPPNRR
ncbi:hypothetical protein (Partial), partial [Seminavis robusta]|eukprot:Sro2435_g327530.1 n/a (184) ;mRNA; r:2-553